MIFTLELHFRNCPTCEKKVVFSMDQCENCHIPFPAEANQMIMQVRQETRQRMQFLWDGGEVDPNQVRFSKFYLYSPSAGYHHIFGIPLYTLEEALIVQNLMYRGLPPHTKTLCPPTARMDRQLLRCRPGREATDDALTLLATAPLG